MIETGTVICDQFQPLPRLCEKLLVDDISHRGDEHVRGFHGFCEIRSAHRFVSHIEFDIE